MARHLITSAIPYINGIKHLGNLVGSQLPADLFARFQRARGNEVMFVCATDEHGTSRPVWLDERGMGHMQGAAVVRDTYYVTSSRGPLRLGRMYVGRPGSFRSYPRTLPVGPEDISYWPSTDLLWSLSEHPGKRFVFCLRRDQFDD